MSDPIDPRRSALLVMDYQPGIVALLDDPQPLLERAARAVAIARDRGATVGYVRVAFTERDLRSFAPTSRMGHTAVAAGERLRDDAPQTAIHAAVAPREGDVIVRKTRVGAFSTTDLHQQLQARGIDTLLLAGISTSGVVLSTVRDGYDRDYRLVVLADACADPNPGTHEFLTQTLYPRQADVISVDELDAQLQLPAT